MITRARQYKALTINDLAIRLNMSDHTIQKMENGRFVRKTSLIRVLRFLEMEDRYHEVIDCDDDTVTFRIEATYKRSNPPKWIRMLEKLIQSESRIFERPSKNPEIVPWLQEHFRSDSEFVFVNMRRSDAERLRTLFALGTLNTLHIAEIVPKSFFLVGGSPPIPVGSPEELAKKLAESEAQWQAAEARMEQERREKQRREQVFNVRLRRWRKRRLTS